MASELSEMTQHRALGVASPNRAQILSFRTVALRREHRFHERQTTGYPGLLLMGIPDREDFDERLLRIELWFELLFDESYGMKYVNHVHFFISANNSDGAPRLRCLLDHPNTCLSFSLHQVCDRP